jgi:hypothetical protein
MTVRTYEAFSVSHASILDGTTAADLALSAEEWPVYGVREGSLSVDEGSYDNTGDDSILSSWFWFNFVNISIKSGYIPFDTIAGLTGNSVTISGSIMSLPLWDVDSQNQAPKPVLIRCPSRDSDGTVRYMDFVLYKCYFMPIKFEGPSYRNGLVVDYSARAVISANDERGYPLSKRAIGRLINRPTS